jgi:vacuolar-type H+-ATPase subunit E/Vma4
MFMQTVNVASIAILSTVAVSYVLDKIKDRHERNLREEIKDRMESTLREANSRIRSLESEADAQKANAVSRETVEKIVGERIEQYESGRVVGDSKNRALNLKLRT